MARRAGGSGTAAGGGGAVTGGSGALAVGGSGSAGVAGGSGTVAGGGGAIAGGSGVVAGGSSGQTAVAGGSGAVAGGSGSTAADGGSGAVAGGNGATAVAGGGGAVAGCSGVGAGGSGALGAGGRSGKGDSKPCWFFQRGGCKFGQKCKWRHISEKAEANGGCAAVVGDGSKAGGEIVEMGDEIRGMLKTAVFYQPARRKDTEAMIKSAELWARMNPNADTQAVEARKKLLWDAVYVITCDDEREEAAAAIVTLQTQETGRISGKGEGGKGKIFPATFAVPGNGGSWEESSRREEREEIEANQRADGFNWRPVQKTAETISRTDSSGRAKTSWWADADVEDDDEAWTAAKVSRWREKGEATAGEDGAKQGSWEKEQQRFQPGDFYCKSCGDHQFARNKWCRWCGADANKDVKTEQTCQVRKPRELKLISRGESQRTWS